MNNLDSNLSRLEEYPSTSKAMGLQHLVESIFAHRIVSIKFSDQEKEPGQASTVCSISLDPIDIVTYYKKGQRSQRSLEPIHIVTLGSRRP